MSHPAPTPGIPPYRKWLYYGGLALIVAGIVCFGSAFFFSSERFFATGETGFERGIVGMGLIFLGGVLRTIGARGLAGSGVVLDPHQARRDVEPWSRMAGGVARDALEETGLLDAGAGKDASTPAHVKVRCKASRALNDEDARYCKQCGGAL